MEKCVTEDYILSDLLNQTAAGNDQALEQLYRKTNQLVYAYLVRTLGNKSFVDEVLVDTFTEIWKSAKKFKGDSKVTTWIIGIARNLAMNQLRRTRNHENIDEYHDLATIADDPVEAEEAKRLMHSAMQQLTVQQREILGLMLLPDFNYPEIADLLNIPVNTVKTRVFYAKAALRQQLQQMGVTAYDV